MFRLTGFSKSKRLTAALLLLALNSCVREERSFRPLPGEADLVQWTRLTDLQAGAGKPVSVHADSEGKFIGVDNRYEENAYALAEGKRFYTAFNCVGCHARGGGDSGPPLMDDQWIYGAEPEQIFATIVEGRPNGMPSFGGRIPAYQIWQIAAYVRSMSGLVRKDAAPGRNDDMKTAPPEHSRPPAPPRPSSTRSSAER